MKRDYIGKSFKPLSSYCYNWHRFVHRAIECKEPRFNNDNSRIFRGTNHVSNRPIGGTNVIRNGIMCYKCNNFGYILRDCKR